MHAGTAGFHVRQSSRARHARDHPSRAPGHNPREDLQRQREEDSLR